MKAYIFPGQASQFAGMGKDMYESSPVAKALFDQANSILGFSITDIMFEGSEEQLKDTSITQPAVFLHSTIKAAMHADSFKPEAVAGHSLGEFSALVAAQVLDFEDGLRLVQQRANAMKKACDLQESTMAAIIGLEDEQVENICASIDEVIVPANYNCPGQLVISGSVKGVQEAVEALSTAGAKKAVVLAVGGAFHSPLMEPAKADLQHAIEQTTFKKPICPIYQNVNALATTDPVTIKTNLVNQLTAPVLWTQTMQNMIKDGVTEFIEVGGTGKVLRGFVKRIDRKFPASAL